MKDSIRESAFRQPRLFTVSSHTFSPPGDLTARFVEEGWLKEITGRKRDRIYAFEPYLEAFKE